LAQVVRELKRLREIGYEIKMSVLGGRGTTCLHSKVSKEKDNAIQQTMDSKISLHIFKFNIFKASGSSFKIQVE